VTVVVTMPGVVGRVVGLLRGGSGIQEVVLRVGLGIGVGKVPVTRVVMMIKDRVKEVVGLGSSVTRVVTATDEGRLDVVGSGFGSSVSLVGMALRDEVMSTGVVSLAVETLAAVELAEVVTGGGNVVTAVGATAAVLLDDDGGLLTPYTRASNIPCGIFATLRSWENTPLPSWIPNELMLLLAEFTAPAFFAQARLLTPLGFRDPPSH
jgi:hypothetical protein